MEWMNDIWAQVADYISVPYLLTFMLLAYSVKRYFEKGLQAITKFNWKTVYTVFILATIIAVPFAIWSDEGWVKILFTYTLSTSLHELIFKYIEKLFKK